MAEGERRGFVFNTPQGDMNMEIEDVMRMANDGDPDGLYALEWPISSVGISTLFRNAFIMK